MKQSIICLVFTIFCISLCAQVLSAEGYGKAEESARNNALANLSQSLYVKVEAKLLESTEEANQKAFSRTLKEISAISSLPILGATYKTAPPKRNEYVSTVYLEAAKALPLYEDRLKAIIKRLSETKSFMNRSTDTSLRYERLMKAQVDLEDFDLHRFIYMALGGKTAYEAPMTQSEIETELHKLRSEFEDLSLALKLSSKDFESFKGIYVLYPAVYPGNETTQLSRVIHDYLLTNLSGVQNSENATYYLRSNYEILESGIVLNLRLADKKGNTLKAAMLRLNPKAYSGYDFRPKTVDLAKQIEMGELISNKLQVQLSGLDGSRQLFYVKDQIVQLRIKSNLPVEYYIVAHAHTEEGVYSYLPFGANQIKRISADQCNRWVELDEFRVTAPFGVETLQVIASTGSLANSIPTTKHDYRYELDKISDDPIKAVAYTRGLKPIAKEVETTETSLTITTSEK